MEGERSEGRDSVATNHAASLATFFSFTLTSAEWFFVFIERLFESSIPIRPAGGTLLRCCESIRCVRAGDDLRGPGCVVHIGPWSYREKMMLVDGSMMKVLSVFHKEVVSAKCDVAHDATDISIAPVIINVISTVL